MSDRPHIIWFFCDQLRADCLGFMGNAHVRTPNLDRLAEAGAIFDKLYVQSPVCMPNRACMLTSRYLRNTGMANGSPLMPPSQVTIAEWLQRRDYGTGMFGKLHLTPQEYTLRDLGTTFPITDAGAFVEAAGLPPMDADPAKQNYGFQKVVAYEDALRGNWHAWCEQQDPAFAATCRDPRDTFVAEIEKTDVGVLEMPEALHPSMFIGDTAAAWFTEQHAEAPLFLHVSFVDPHHPFDPPRETAERYRPEELPLPKYQEPGDVWWPQRLIDRACTTFSATEAQTRLTIARYYAMIEVIDRAVGRVIEAVEAAGEMENTIFAFVADHGELLGDDGRWRKGSYHQECIIRVPAFIAAPGRMPGGQRIAGMVEAIDLCPTLLSLAGQPIYPGMQGIDMAAALQQGGEIGRRWVYTEMYTGSWGPFIACWTLRTETAKLNYYPEERRGQLFDLVADPDERKDLWCSDAARELRDTMMANLLEEIHQQADPLPLVLSQY